MNIEEIAKELGCTLRNNTSIDLANINGKKVVDWLMTNGFKESKLVRNRYYKNDFYLQMDWVGGFLYIP